MLQHTLVTSDKVMTRWKVVKNTLGSPSPSLIWAHSKITNPLNTGFFTFFKIFNGELSPSTKSFKIQVGTSLEVTHAKYGVNRPKKSEVAPQITVWRSERVCPLKKRKSRRQSRNFCWSDYESDYYNLQQQKILFALFLRHFCGFGFMETSSQYNAFLLVIYFDTIIINV